MCMGGFEAGSRVRIRVSLAATLGSGKNHKSHTIVRRAGGDVGGDVVVGVDEPVRGGGLVDREPGEGLARVGAEVVCDHVLGLDAVLYEVRVPHGLEVDVVGHAQVVHPVDGNRAVVRVWWIELPRTYELRTVPIMWKWIGYRPSRKPWPA